MTDDSDAVRPSGSSDSSALRPSGSSPRRRLTPEDRRAELLEFGTQLFGEHHYDDVRMDEVAEQAGVSRALLYRYFPDKRSFYTAVMQAEYDRLYDATISLDLDPALSGFERIRNTLLVYLHYQEEHPYAPVTVFRMIDSADPTVTAIEQQEYDKQTDRIMAVLDHIAGNEVTPQLDIELRVVIRGWLAFNQELARQRSLNPQLDVNWLADTSAHAMIDAVRRVSNVPQAVLDLMGSD
ncbi:TetR/AcrR family transcriptional regulator [Mycobacterium sp. CBMA271]|uniref:TetR/AcrR family transcriptional regulator n=1 Tax=unclassified Mycobacteroides TaxID=2618759 RepID=UPI0012DF5728|nr:MULTISPECIES: TetR/AcrR family transcriptional regulator [unclassified Mycobacteroides]MUM16415.1 TetR family transcriptional regulator [Mycobacteroides sp. CBMA 326]MUM20641.1 TetR/AcrR family transcriptional regulator [Mycobacteroides sp. CBMA 271]